MNALAPVLIAAILFVGTHFLLSHPLRRPIVGAIGEQGFMVVYSVVAVATIAWLAHAYKAAPSAPFLWTVGNGIWAVATVVMLFASVLLMGSLIRNPAFPGPATTVPVPKAQGVFAITRHPMNWAFALWGACHIAVYPLPANLILAGAIIVLALVGSVLQDIKKARLQPDRWPAWEAQTSFVPFAAMLAGRARWGRAGLHTWAGGVVIWLAATWAHLPLAGWAAGIWRWVV